MFLTKHQRIGRREFVSQRMSACKDRGRRQRFVGRRDLPHLEHAALESRARRTHGPSRRATSW